MALLKVFNRKDAKGAKSLNMKLGVLCGLAVQIQILSIGL
jgi:hypothetical protein